MAKGTFDVQGFFAALDAARRERKKNWKEVAGDAKVSASTLTRLAQGHRPDIDGLASLLAWSGLRAEQFIREPSGDEPPTLAMISTYLRADPKLSPESATALERIVEAAYEQMREPDDATPARVQERGTRGRP